MGTNILRYIAFALTAAAAATGPAAAEADAIPIASEVVITAPLRNAAGESLSGVVVLDREDLVARPTGGLGDMLERAPGISSTGFAAGASRPIVRGLGEDRIRVLTNGLGQIDASSVSPDHAIATDGLEAQRIEVLRGASAIAYGGNAIAGVVNVIDGRIIEAKPERAFSGDALITGATGTGAFEAAGAATFAGERAALRIDAFRRETDDFDIPGFALSTARQAEEIAEALGEGEPAPAFESGTAANSFTETDGYSVSGSVYGSWGFAALSARRLTSLYGLPEAGHHDGEEGDEEEAIFAGPRIDLQADRYEAHGAWRGRLGLFTELRGSLALVDYQHTEIEESGEVGTLFSNEGLELRLEAPHQRGPLQGVVGVTGLSSDFVAEGEEAFVTPTEIQEAGLFVQERIEIGAFALEGGARYERRTYDNTVFGERDFDLVSASLGGSWRPTEPLFLALTISRTERAPTEIELFADGAHLATAAYEEGDPTLKREVSLALEGVARLTLRRTDIEVSLFRTAFDGFIAATDTGVEDEESGLPIFAFRQADADFWGGEIAARRTLAAGGGWALSADGALDYVRGELDAGGNVPRVPPLSATLGLDAAAGPLAARAELVAVAEQDETAAFETPTDGYTLLNAQLAYVPSFWEGRTRLVLDARNLGDEEARQHTAFTKDILPRPGRSVRLALRATF